MLKHLKNRCTKIIYFAYLFRKIIILNHSKVWENGNLNKENSIVHKILVSCKLSSLRFHCILYKSFLQLLALNLLTFVIPALYYLYDYVNIIFELHFKFSVVRNNLVIKSCYEQEC